MSNTPAPFVPSPGIPNAAHARFYAEVAKQGGNLAPPASGGQQFQTPESASRIAQMAAQHAKTAQPRPVAAAPTAKTDNVAEFDAAMERLIDLKRSIPLDKQTTAWKLDWEKQYNAAAQPGESAPAKPAEVEAPIPPTETKELTPALDFVLKYSSRDGMMSSQSLPPVLTSGYKLVPGVKIHAETAIAHLAQARKDGLSQAVVDAYLNDLKRNAK